MQIHELKRKTIHKKSRQVGRGGKRGKTSGRGTKGQKARSGHKIRPESRDLIKKIPKLRGYAFQSFKAEFVPLNVERLEVAFSKGDVVSPKTLAEKGVVATLHGAYQRIKILSRGELTKALVISGCAVSKPALAKIEAAGGKIEQISVS
jgi:large subunit ribosomal protein L15